MHASVMTTSQKDQTVISKEDNEVSKSQTHDANFTQHQVTDRLVEVDQDDKAIAIGNRINLQSAQPYMIMVMNQYAAKAHRLDFVEQIRSKVTEFFMESPKTFK